MAVIKISSGVHMSALLSALGNDIIQARFHYDLLIALSGEFTADPRVYNQSAAFWGLISTALRDAVIVRLARVYDQQRNSLSLLNWLETIRANLRLFENDAFRARLKDNPFVESLAKAPRVPDATQLDRDIERVKQADPAVKRLIRLRNNGSAHVSAGTVAAGGDPFWKHALLSDEYVELLDRSREILNRYSDLFDASSFSARIVGHDDYKFIIRTIRDRLDAEETAVGAESG